MLLKNLRVLLIPIILLTGLFVFLMYKKREQTRIILAGNFTEGIVFDVQNGSVKGSRGFFNYYHYRVGGKKYIDRFKVSGYSTSEIRGKKYQEFIGGRFKIFYDKNDSKKNVISRESFLGTNIVLREFYLNKLKYGEKLAFDLEFFKFGTTATGLITNCYWNKSQRKHFTKFEYIVDGEILVDSVDFEARKGCAYTKSICLGKYFEFRFSKRDPSINLADFRELRTYP